MRCFAGVIIALLITPMAAFAQITDDEGDNEALVQIEEYGWFLKSGKWTNTNIEVCWEAPTAQFVNQRNAVQESIEVTWERYSKLDFFGWDACPPDNFVGIRIKVADEIPRVEGLGSDLSGVPNGMVLNFTYDNPYFRSCRRDDTMYKLCNHTIAVHEFGHAIGFTHEHNRLDRDEACTRARTGTDGDVELTPYDPDSVMNYCTPQYLNYGKMSYGDVVSVQNVYGKPE